MVQFLEVAEVDDIFDIELGPGHVGRCRNHVGDDLVVLQLGQRSLVVGRRTLRIAYLALQKCTNNVGQNIDTDFCAQVADAGVNL